MKPGIEWYRFQRNLGLWIIIIREGAQFDSACEPDAWTCDGLALFTR